MADTISTPGDEDEIAAEASSSPQARPSNGAPTVWQVAAGSDQRDYADEFLRFGLAFVGGESQMDALAQVRPGDLLILKRGKSAVVAVGRAVERGGSHFGNGDKPWLRDFDGWDLPAYVRMDWRKPITTVPADGLTIGTIKRVNTVSLRRAAEAAYANGIPVGEPLADPRATRGVPDAEILQFLVSEGLRPSLAEELTAALARIRLLARYYRSDRRYWDHVREHETRTFLVAPLLLALGWAEQQIKIELKAMRGERQGGSTWRFSRGPTGLTSAATRTTWTARSSSRPRGSPRASPTLTARRRITRPSSPRAERWW